MRKRNPFRWNTEDELFPDFELALHEATVRGYSVVEIARILGNKTSLNLYGIMRTAGIIPKLPAGRVPKLDIDGGLIVALEKCNLSFSRWANSHDLDPLEMSIALKTPVDKNNPTSVRAHKAFRQDFCQLYCKTYKLPVEPTRAGARSEVAPINDHRIIIEPDKDNDRYRAYVDGLEDCSSFGGTYDEAYFSLKSRYVLLHSIRKLRLLPDKRQVA